MAKPKFLYDSRFDDATPVASSTAAGDFNVLNLRDWRAYTWWKPASIPATVTVDSGSAKARDFLLVYGEAGTYEARGSTDNFAASDVLLASITLTKPGIGIAFFTSTSHRYTRLMIPSGTAPAVAIAVIGAALEAPVFLEGSFSPIDRLVMGQSNRNENGHPLGRIVYFEEWSERILLPNVAWSWARDTFVPAWTAHLRGSPFGFVWESELYPEDVRIVSSGERLSIPHRSGSLADVELEVKGLHVHAASTLNSIGTPGTQTFGVGRYPTPNLPGGFSRLPGSDIPNSDEYGNYQYSDGSVMVWVPAFFYKWGTGENGLALNAVDVKPFSAYSSVAAANVDGYALHRAFYDGGVVRKGFFVDKYLCSNNGGVASSLLNGNPLSSNAAHNPFADLTGAPANNYSGAIAAAKTRGADFFCSTRFIFAALAMLSYAHGQAAAAATWCAWYDGAGVTNFPKGNNNNLLGDVDDGTLSFVSDGFGVDDSSKTGSGDPFAKTTHNGQASGVCDLNGNMWEITVGLATDAAGAEFFVLKTSAAMKDVGGGNALATDLWGAEGIAALYDVLGATFEEALATSTTKLYGAAGAQVIADETSGNLWQWAGLGAPLLGGAAVGGGTNAFGKDRFDDYRVANLCPLSGADWGGGSNAGVWALNLSGARTGSTTGVGFRAASYL